MYSRIIIILLVLLTALILPTGRLQAVGIGVIPSSLELEASPLSSTKSTLTVLNSSDEEVLYQVSIEGDCQSWFSIAPLEFTLQPQESQEITVTLTPPITASGDHDISICIVGLTHASELKIGCGVKIPTHVSVLTPLPFSAIGIDITGLPLLGLIGGTLAGIISGIMIRRRRRFREVT